ncbi:MAG: DUF421 domain-containing protein [Rudaea sp.]
MNLSQPLFLSVIAVRTVIIVLVLVFAIRVFGKRDVGGMNLIDLVLVLLLGNAVQNALTTGSGELGVGLVSAAVLLIADRLMGILFVRRPWLERELFGGPTVIASHGKLDQAAMKHEDVSEDEILTAARAIGVRDLSGVRMAVLEEDGSISIVPEEKES